MLQEQFLLFCYDQATTILAAWTAIFTHIKYTHTPCMQDADPCQLAIRLLVCQLSFSKQFLLSFLVLKGPLMLEMGVLPDVAAATSATMILFTSASASVVYLSFGGVA